MDISLMQASQLPITPSYLVQETRALVDLAKLPFTLALNSLTPKQRAARPMHIYLLPGFGAGALSMKPLGYYLSSKGHHVYDWGLGVNKAGLNQAHDPNQLSWKVTPPEPYQGEAGVVYLSDMMSARVSQYHKDTSQKVTLIGWSLGGTIAREVARDLPDVIEHVITLGSPLVGGPKYTRAASLLKKRGLNLDWIEQQVCMRNQIPLRCKHTAFVSETDGIVSAFASRSHHEQSTRYIQTNAAHLSLAINAKVMQTISALLEEN